MKAKPISFHTTQRQFCDWIRDPELEPPQNFAVNRMQVYRDLLFNNVCSFINLVFPVARSMFAEQQWQQLLAEFFQKSQCQSPFYNDISLQFREYFTEQQHQILQDYPWLNELLQYEWLELYLDTVEIETPILIEDQDWQLTTQVWILVYQYPVYRWTTTMKLEQVQQAPSVILVWRDDLDQVRVEVVSPLYAAMIELIQQNRVIEQDLQRLIQSILPDFDEEQIQLQIYGLKALLTRLRLIHVPHNNDEIQG
ncbi:putative DNA-binding domain-containing protein [Acinetobacter colistiniresistens]|uniref:HvfC family RiPP maturation protein n=1 Tax=Acinetobacter colistiniresistens TaxID=280145 RepID=UPI00211C915E|nr:putative DNA-binding domain-containing protein [Acinetobacter colistiniresistens]UUM26634.1 putative DNA-binding domain-containing protein [Acinetobacter colistiniresistens]